MARCQRSWWSVSATDGAEALLQLRLQRLELLALALEAAVVREVEVRSRQRVRRGRSSELALDLLRLEDLEHVAFLDVGEALEHDAALEAGLDLAGVLLEAPQRADPAV